MTVVQSKINPKLKWRLKVNNCVLTALDKEFIEMHSPAIFNNRTKYKVKIWAFDTKLPSGAWLNNITFNDKITVDKATVEVL